MRDICFIKVDVMLDSGSFWGGLVILSSKYCHLNAFSENEADRGFFGVSCSGSAANLLHPGLLRKFID